MFFMIGDKVVTPAGLTAVVTNSPHSQNETSRIEIAAIVNNEAVEFVYFAGDLKHW